MSMPILQGHLISDSTRLQGTAPVRTLTQWQRRAGQLQYGDTDKTEGYLTHTQ